MRESSERSEGRMQSLQSRELVWSRSLLTVLLGALLLLAAPPALAEDATVGQPEIMLGIIPGAGGTQRLPRLVGYQRAKEMNLSGRHVTASEALEMGLADKVVPTAELVAVAMADAAEWATGPTLGYSAVKSAMNQGWGQPIEEALAVERRVFNQVFGGGFSSRLMRRVRIVEGLTYGASGGFSSSKVSGHLSVRTFTRTEETVKTVKVLLLENSDEADRTVRFRVDAMLYAEPAPEPVVFDSQLEPSNSDFKVTGQTR